VSAQSRRENPVRLGTADWSKMTTKTKRPPTCQECYFHQEGLCALAGNAVCPTFRAAKPGSLAPPLQPQLVPRPLRQVAVGQAA